jgi:hypothetical protein
MATGEQVRGKSTEWPLQRTGEGRQHTEWLLETAGEGRQYKMAAAMTRCGKTVQNQKSFIQSSNTCKIRINSFCSTKTLVLNSVL